MLSVLLSALVEIFSVSRMQDFFFRKQYLDLSEIGRAGLGTDFLIEDRSVSKLSPLFTREFKQTNKKIL